MGDAYNDYLLTRERRINADKKVHAENVHKQQQVIKEIHADPEEAIARERDLGIAQTIGHELSRSYPQRGWIVEADSRNGIANIYLKHMSSTHGYRYKLKDMDIHTFQNDMMKVGGEILERFGLTRGRFQVSEVANAIRDARGNARVDLS